MRNKIIVAIMVFNFCLFSCSNIEGIYVLNNNSKDTLKLFSNGTYQRKYLNNDEVLVKGGTWKKEAQDIFFYNWINGNRDSIIRGMKVEQSLFNKEVLLFTDYDNDFFYRKIN